MWCELCRCSPSNEGCKTCDSDYLGTLIVAADNDLLCIQQESSQADIHRRIDAVHNILTEMWDLHPRRYHKQLVWELP